MIYNACAEKQWVQYTLNITWPSVPHVSRQCANSHASLTTAVHPSQQPCCITVLKRAVERCPGTVWTVFMK